MISLVLVTVLFLTGVYPDKAAEETFIWCGFIGGLKPELDEAVALLMDCTGRRQMLR